MVNLPKGNLQIIKRHHVTNFPNNLIVLFEKITWKQRSDVLGSKKALHLIKVIDLHVINHLLDMEQFVLVSASMYNKCLNNQTVTKQKLLKYQFELKPTRKKDSIKEEITKKLFAKAYSLVNKSLSCPRIKPSNAQTLTLDGLETCLLLSDFA